METEKAKRPYYADPTANTAIGNVMREERAAKRKRDMELRKSILKDVTAVLREAKCMGCKTANFNAIPVENLELTLEALRAYGRR